MLGQQRGDIGIQAHQDMARNIHVGVTDHGGGNQVEYAGEPLFERFQLSELEVVLLATRTSRLTGRQGGLGFGKFTMAKPGANRHCLLRMG